MTQRHAPLTREAVIAAACFTGLMCLQLNAAAQTAGTGTAPAGGTAMNAGQASLDTSDRKFVEKAAMGGMAEVELGRLAQQKASHQQVKEFGARMAQDHGKANTELQQIAASKGIQLPADSGRSHKKDADKFGKMDAAKFDREYMEHMVDDHKKDISEFEKASRSAKDPDIKAFAARTLPTLQEHLKQAQATHDAVKKNR